MTEAHRGFRLDAQVAITEAVCRRGDFDPGRLVLGHLAINQQQPPSDRKGAFRVLDLTALIGDPG